MALEPRQTGVYLLLVGEIVMKERGVYVKSKKSASG